MYSMKATKNLQIWFDITKKISKNRNDFMKVSFSQKPTKLLPEFLPTLGRNPDKNVVGFGEKRCLQKFISVHTDL